MATTSDQLAPHWKAQARRSSRSVVSKRDAAAAPLADRRVRGTHPGIGPRPTMRDPRRVAVLISGRGSNMRALAENAVGYDVALIASNKTDAAGLEWARARRLSTWAKDSKGIAKEAFDRELSQALDEHDVGTIALAGFMRILSPWFVDELSGRIVNIHPSLL